MLAFWGWMDLGSDSGGRSCSGGHSCPLLTLHSPRGASSGPADRGPSSCKVFVNVLDGFDFASAAELKPDASFELSADKTNYAIFGTPAYVKFQVRVRSVWSVWSAGHHPATPPTRYPATPPTRYPATPPTRHLTTRRCHPSRSSSRRTMKMVTRRWWIRCVGRRA